MAKVNRPGAKTTSRLVERVTRLPRRPGRLKGRIRIGADFDAPLPPALLRAFGGGRDEAAPRHLAVSSGQTGLA